MLVSIRSVVILYRVCSKLLLFLFNSLPGFVLAVWESLVCLFTDFMESIFIFIFLSRSWGRGWG